MSCPTCGRAVPDGSVSDRWRVATIDAHTDWCDEVRRQHHDDDVRRFGSGTTRMTAWMRSHGFAHPEKMIRDFERWGYEVLP